MTETTYTLLAADDSIVAQGISRADAVRLMFLEGGHVIELRPFDDEDPEICLCYKPIYGGSWTPYPLTPPPKEPVTEDHYYSHAIKNWDHSFTILTDKEAKAFLAENF
ncbi:hypothetical protein [Brevundimonas sp.]|uniref:hypothetical protein n=1 Tax=Brevundimonas sp. TaxID=1871086 RepID=UPI0028AE5FA3|nr:hypothetical protein [Brevundimonas sp.]